MQLCSAALRECSEYQRLAYHDVAAVGLSLASVVSITQVPTCDSISASLIVGGTHAKPKEFPHMAALGWRRPSDNTTFFRCGGSLISERYILTAAHCLDHIEGAYPRFVRLGDVHLLRDDDGARPRDYEIEDYFTHQEDFSNELMKVSLQIYDNEHCSKNYKRNKKLRRGMKDSQLCAGDSRGGYDTCEGDSGGPLQITEQGNHCSFIVFGITSFGAYCGGTNPAVYTRVAAYLDWIEGIVWP
ncbi:hypothetical protein RP20_CCG023234 [Aedes albopictus]|nr:hypothetical protein RP20_CCG023234 [Aedes albopictus]